MHVWRPLTVWLLSSFLTAVVLADDAAGRAMPNRFLFTCLGWLTSQGGQDYYPREISDQLVQDWHDYAAYMKEVGFTSIGPWGFLCNTMPYPLGVGTPSAAGEGTVRISTDKLRQARRIVEGCHAQDIRFFYGMCVYFVYWQDYVAACPEAAPVGPSVLCPTYMGDASKNLPGSTEMMKRAMDFLVDSLPLDGIAIESFHHGRCVCPRCLDRFPNTARGTAEFHWFANKPIFEHIRRRHPSVKILFCPEGPLEVIQRSENMDILKKTLKAVDYFVWCSQIHPPEVMRELAAEAPDTGLMFRQEPWQSVPPPASDRDGWFFPNLVNPLGRTIRERASVIPWAGVAGCGLGKVNPCDNVNLRFLARMQQAPLSDPEVVARELLAEIYAPKDAAALDKLYSVFSEPELSFRELWPTWFMHIDFMPKAYKFTALQTVKMINAYQLALARLRSVKPDLGHVAEADRLETSIVKWIEYIQDRLRDEYQYDVPGAASRQSEAAAAAPVSPPAPRDETTAGGRVIRPASAQDGSIVLATGAVDTISPAAQWGEIGGKGLVFVSIHSLPDDLESGSSGRTLLRIPQTDNVWTTDTSAERLRMLVQHIDAADDTSVTLPDGASTPLGLIGVYREPGPATLSIARFREFDVTEFVRADLQAGRASFAIRLEPEAVADQDAGARYFPSVDNTDNAFPRVNRGSRLIFIREQAATPDRQDEAIEDGAALELPVRRRLADETGTERVLDEVWRVPISKVAFVTQHLWNNGEPGGPPQPPHLMIGNGTPANLKRTREVNARYILPALKAARAAGMTVVHSEPAFIANRYRQYKAISAEVSGKPAEEPWPPAIIPEYTAEEMAGWTVDTWPGWGQMDFPRALRPREEEPVTVLSKELDHVLRKRGVTSLVYVGYATDMCLVGYTGGLNDMVHKFGFKACVLREATLATEQPEGLSGPEKTAESLERIERDYACTASVADFLAALEDIESATRASREN